MAPWYEEAEFYHIYPIGLTGAPRKNESEETVHRFSTLEQWLPHIADLGCTAIYIGPLFESTTHGYDTKDYKQVDRRLGDNADFAAYVKKAQELGITHAMHGAVFLRVGSSNICSEFNSGSCSFTRSAYRSFVTISMFSVGITLLKRSKVC